MRRLLFILGCCCAFGVATAATELVYFALGQDGATRNQDVPGELREIVQARPGLGELTPLPANRLAWQEALAPATAPRLVIVVVRLGTRFETVALHLRPGGTVGWVARRPAASTADMRRDRGQPGAEQLLINSWTELAADLDAVLREQPGGLSGEPVTLSVSSREAAGATVDAPSASAETAAGLEALGLASLALNGVPVRRVADGGALQLRAVPRAVRLLLVCTAGERSFTMPAAPQESAVPYLQMGWRKVLRWHEAVSDFRVFSPTWSPVSILAASEARLLLRTGPESWLIASPRDGSIKSFEKPPEDLATPWLVEDRKLTVGEWNVTFDAAIGGALTRDGGDLLVATDDGLLHRLDAATGKASGRADLGRRLRGSSGRVIGGRLWATDSGGTLLAIDPASGALAWERPVRDVLLVSPLAWGEQTWLVLTRSRFASLIREDGSEVGSFAFPASPEAALIVEDEAGRAQEAIVSDRLGGIWRWTVGEPEPRLVAELGLRPNGPLALVEPFPARWPKEQSDELLDDLVDMQRSLLVATAEGVVLTLPWPRR